MAKNSPDSSQPVVSWKPVLGAFMLIVSLHLVSWQAVFKLIL